MSRDYRKNKHIRHGQHNHIFQRCGCVVPVLNAYSFMLQKIFDMKIKPLANAYSGYEDNLRAESKECRWCTRYRIYTRLLQYGVLRECITGATCLTEKEPTLYYICGAATLLSLLATKTRPAFLLALNTALKKSNTHPVRQNGMSSKLHHLAPVCSEKRLMWRGVSVSWVGLEVSGGPVL